LQEFALKIDVAVPKSHEPQTACYFPTIFMFWVWQDVCHAKLATSMSSEIIHQCQLFLLLQSIIFCSLITIV